MFNLQYSASMTYRLVINIKNNDLPQIHIFIKQFNTMIKIELGTCDRGLDLQSIYHVYQGFQSFL